MQKPDDLIPPLLAWFARSARDLPWRRTRDPYAVWVSEIMLQQTQVKTVIPYWKRWMKELPTIPALAQARPEQVLKLWEGLGYYARARHLHQAARMIVDQQGGRFPDSFEEVLALPGIGRYTAGAICSIAFNQPAPVLDGNVIRVLTRFFGIRGHPRRRRTSRRLWTLAEQLVTAAALASAGRAGHSLPRGTAASRSLARSKTKDRNCSSLNQALMELGATVCTPRQPRCSECPVRLHCFAYLKSQIDRFPNLGTRTATVPRHFVAFVIRNGARLLVRQRPAGVVNAHFWEFPNIEVSAAEAEPASAALANRRHRPTRVRPAKLEPVSAAARLFGRPLKSFRPLGRVRHSITRSRITMEVFEIAAHDFFCGNGPARAKRPDSRAGRTGGGNRSSADPFAESHGSGAAISELGQMRWASVSELKKLPLATAHRKVLNAVLR
ncbi:MAG: A/G-specific adenine glycosylase [Chloroflexi bacterium]|nr:A/G-specific adenine glycosylase [Chloroflexota bacterium]